jgi:alpha-D-ribose 1-methylphosphonate 5-triphosphate diphosphatase
VIQLKAIINGNIVTPLEVLKNKVLLIKDDIIWDIIDMRDFKKYNYESIIDARNRYITPGFIDTHSDHIEQIVQPRPTSIMNFELALMESEKQLLSQGITTMYHSLSLFKDDYFGVSHLRHRDNVMKIADLIFKFQLRNHLIRHRFHLRVEIDNIDAFDIVKALILENKVHQISFMDHTPGQGQYKNLDIYKKTITAYKGQKLAELGFEGVIEHHSNKKILSFEQLRELSYLAEIHNIPVASHDDDSEQKLAINRDLGITLSEFPITIEIAKEAKRLGFYTVAGSPNILLGGSHSGNMSASDAILEGCVDILCSDYYPAAMLHSVFFMVKKYNIPLNEMINKVTLNPAKAMKIDLGYGSVENGKKADILIIDGTGTHPVITNVLVNGEMTSTIEYRYREA